ncbi:MAG: ParB/RepB/Spo0J family partition protein [Candidatus Ryanbacteria bacterium]|nr:ParB/RepB/Spo0J family partition protein [Candidatus Ryanbacteria bacterium]
MPDELKEKESVFWIPIEKIKPNPYQPRTEFDEAALKGLAESIRQYGILQALVVTRIERESETGTEVTYELVAGERRFRASQMIGLREVPVTIRREEPAKVRLELALVENVQRQDLNAIERAIAYKRLIDEFGMKQPEIAGRVGKSRESIANTIRILMLPQDMQEAVRGGKITEGHTRPLLMLSTRPEEQKELFLDILDHHISVREAERISRRIARERARKVEDLPSAETRAVEERLGNVLGTRVEIHKEAGGKGKISIEFFSDEELYGIAAKLMREREERIENERLTQATEEQFTV